MTIERDINKFLIIAIGAAVVADIITHGQAAVAVGNVVFGFITNVLRIASGQTAK